MRGQNPTTDISDTVVCREETGWIEGNWRLYPHTRSLRKILITIIVSAGLALFMSPILYLELGWKKRMNSLYDAYLHANNSLHEIGYCGTQACYDRKHELEWQAHVAWRKVCDADILNGEYVNLLRQKNYPTRSCN